jgi:energy-coupling factor transporter ATP-binding protein EcfA2
VIRLSRVTFRYPDAPQPAVKDVSLTIGAGELVAVLGNNGSGKTTLSKLILGLLKPTDGSIEVFGEPVVALNPRQVRDFAKAMASWPRPIASTPRCWRTSLMRSGRRCAHCPMLRRGSWLPW